MPQRLFIALIMMITANMPTLGMSELPSKFLNDGIVISRFVYAVRMQDYKTTEEMLTQYVALSAAISDEAKTAFQSQIDKALWECAHERPGKEDKSKALAICKLLCKHGANPNGFTFLQDKSLEIYTRFDGANPQGLKITRYKRNPAFTTLDVAIARPGHIKTTIHPDFICYLLDRGARGCRINDPERDEFEKWHEILSHYPAIKRSYAKNLIYQSSPPSLKERLVFHFAHDDLQADLSQTPEELRELITDMRKRINSIPTEPSLFIDFSELELSE
jgi:hypothetical protein